MIFPKNVKVAQVFGYFLVAIGFSIPMLTGCSSNSSQQVSAPAPVSPAASPLDVYKLTGDVSFIHDPSIIRQGSTYYALTTDPGTAVVGSNPTLANGLQIRCSTDKLSWKICGKIFSSIPSSVLAALPGTTSLWAPDISYFNGLYHVYYTASSFGSNHSVIGLVTTPTLVSTDPAYKWTDQGIVLSSQAGDAANAIDANIFVDTDASGNLTHVWLQYGSFYGGIYQREINPLTGLLSTTNTAVTLLATRPGVLNNPIEGASLVKKNGFYYLFVSFDYCCQTPASGSNYKIEVGRGTSANGPFADQSGTSMLQGGGTLVLAGNGTTWAAPGGQSIYIDPTGGDLITFHALSVNQNYLDYLYVNSITWTGDWPAIQP